MKTRSWIAAPSSYGKRSSRRSTAAPQEMRDEDEVRAGAEYEEELRDDGAL